MSKAIAQILPEQLTTLSISRNMFVEEAICDEAQSMQADVIVLGKSQEAAWRRLLNRVLGNDPNIAAYLCTHTDAEVIVSE